MQQEGNSKRLFGIIAAVVLAALLIALILFMVNRANDMAQNNAGDQAATTEQPASEEDGALLDRIVDNPDQYIGQTVTVDREIQDVLSNRIFKISRDVAGDELTVLSRQALSDEQAAQAEEFLQDNANVQVRGTVTRATVAEVERDYGIDLDAGLEAEFENRTVLVADSVAFTDRSGAAWEFNAEPGVQPDDGGTTDTTQQQ